MIQYLSGFSKVICIRFSLAALLVTALSEPVAFAAATAYEGGVYTASLETVRAKLKRWGFPESSKTPSLYMTDFFGVLRLNDALTPDDVVKSLTPKYAVVVSETGPALRLRFDDTWWVDFYFDAVIEIDTGSGPPKTDYDTAPHYNFAVMKDANSSENEREFLQKLWSVLEKEELQDRFLKKNPYFAEEELAFRTMQNNPGGSGVKELAGFDAFLMEENAVYLLPDNVHGNRDRYQVMVEHTKAEGVDWIAIEMLGVEMQDAARDFVKGETNSASYQQAERRLLDYYRTGWQGRFGEKKAEDNYYFQLLKMARDGKKGAYALDAVPEYILFRYGEFPLGAATRNVVWAKQVPGRGRGLVFGVRRT